MQNQTNKSPNSESVWEGTCSICGHTGLFERSHKSIREGYPCPKCKATLRYRHQAEMILKIYGSPAIHTLSDLALHQDFNGLRIYEPGVIGPFRKYFKIFPGYHQSYFWNGARNGENFNGIRCENLEALTFENDFFDLIITSDIFEHIRKPFVAFNQIHRVLKPGGYHIFTVPMAWPLSEKTGYRVDTNNAQDVHIQKPVYHGSPVDKSGSLVYTDFGLDIVSKLGKIGFNTDWQGIQYNLTFVSQKKSENDAASKMAGRNNQDAEVSQAWA